MAEILTFSPLADEAPAKDCNVCWLPGGYPELHAGPLAAARRFREGLKKFHAQKAAEILRETGYDPEMIARVQALNLKQNFPDDPEARVLEDALCLVFLERQFKELAAKTAEDKVINALQKSWKKMTPVARTLALRLHYGSREAALLQRALNPGAANQGRPGQKLWCMLRSGRRPLRPRAPRPHV